MCHNGTANIAIVSMICPWGYSPWKGVRGRAALKTPFSCSLSSFLRPPFQLVSVLYDPFLTKITNFTKFAVLELNLSNISVTFSRMWSAKNRRSPIWAHGLMTPLHRAVYEVGICLVYVSKAHFRAYFLVFLSLYLKLCHKKSNKWTTGHKQSWRYYDSTSKFCLHKMPI